MRSLPGIFHTRVPEPERRTSAPGFHTSGWPKRTPGPECWPLAVSLAPLWTVTGRGPGGMTESESQKEDRKRSDYGRFWVLEPSAGEPHAHQNRDLIVGTVGIGGTGCSGGANQLWLD